jgi:hypothetical protein
MLLVRKGPLPVPSRSALSFAPPRLTSNYADRAKTKGGASANKKSRLNVVFRSSRNPPRAALPY